MASVMSRDGEIDSVMRGIKHGACDYLLKPVRLEELRNIWQHVVRKLVSPILVSKEESGELDEYPKHQDNADFDATSRKRKERLEDETQLVEDVNNLKKARIVWSPELHQQFVNAVNYLGVDKAVPRKILDIMNVQGLTRENVASHLQKYRSYLKRLIGVTPQPHPVASFQAAENGTFGGTMQIQPGGRPTASSSTKGLNLGGAAAISSISGLNRGGSQIDAATLNTLVQLQSLQQKQLGTTASRVGLTTDLVSLQTPADPTGPQMLDSFELDLLMKAQHDSRQRGGGGTDYTALLSGSKDTLPNMSSLRGHVELKPAAMGSTNLLAGSEPMTAMSMSNLRGSDDLGPGLGGVDVGRSHLVNKWGGEFSNSSAFSSLTSRSNGGAVSESSFSIDYGDIPDVPPEFLVASPSDLSLLGQLQAFDQGELDYDQLSQPRWSMSYSSKA